MIKDSNFIPNYYLIVILNKVKDLKKRCFISFSMTI
jgi:hypothetical protein